MFFSSTPPLFETKKTQSHTRQLVNPFFSKTFGLKKKFSQKIFLCKTTTTYQLPRLTLGSTHSWKSRWKHPEKMVTNNPSKLGSRMELNGWFKRLHKIPQNAPQKHLQFFKHISLATLHLTHGMLSKEFWCQGAEVWIGSHSGGRFLLRLVPIMTIATVEVVGTW